jgi:hypothetical protein
MLPPIVRTDGIPTTAALDLLAGLSAKGLSTSVRADVDDAGLVVVEQVLSVANEATLWRYDTATYAAHLGLPIRAHRRTATRGTSWRGYATCTGYTAPRSTKRSY